MLIINYPILIANSFIELNKKSEVKRIKIENIHKLAEILKQKSYEQDIYYIEKLDSTSFYDMKFNYHQFFNVYEDIDGFGVTLLTSIENLKNCFQKNNNNELLQLLENINFEEIFNYSKKR